MAAAHQSGNMQWMMEQMADLSLVDLITFGAQCAIVFGGIVPFVPQYREIRRSRNSEGFSLFVCLVLLIANILRIMFWFGRHFELPLLMQSVVMVLCMLAMIQLCVHVNQIVTVVPVKPRVFRGSSQGIHGHEFFDFEPEYFWKWTNFFSYIQCLTVITIVTGLFTYIFLQVPVVIETIGFLALFFEAMLGMPQFYRNFTNKSTEGMSIIMVCMWLSGDTFKTGYFLARHAPAQFWVCGSLQVMVDLAILGQVLYFRLSPQTTPHRKPHIHQ